MGYGRAMILRLGCFCERTMPGTGKLGRYERAKARLPTLLPCSYFDGPFHLVLKCAPTVCPSNPISTMEMENLTGIEITSSYLDSKRLPRYDRPLS